MSMPRGLRTFKAYLFDMGGTLLDFHACGPSDEEKNELGIKRFAMLCTRKYGLPSSLERSRQELFKPWLHYLEHERKRVRLEADFGKRIVDFMRSHGITVDLADVLELAGEYYSPYSEHVLVNPGAEVCLRTLKALGKHVGVVSNASLPDAVYLAMFKERGLDAFIDAYSFSHSNRHMKPHESIFLRALEACRCAPGEALMIGDKYEVDILGARRVGCRSCLYGPSEGEADYRIGSFHDFLAQLEDDSRLGCSPRNAP